MINTILFLLNYQVLRMWFCFLQQFSLCDML